MTTSTSASLATRDDADAWSDLDRLFDDLRGRFWGTGFSPAWSAAIVPRGASARLGPRAAPTDVTDTGPSYKIVAEIPGIPKENLKIRIRGTAVEIEGTATESTEQKDGELLFRERRQAAVYRAFELPEPIVAGDAKAKITDGVLELELPKEKPTPAPAEVTVPVQ